MKVRKIVIVNGGDEGLVAADIVESLPEFEMIGFLDDDLKVDTEIGLYKKFPVLGATSLMSSLIKDLLTFVVITHKNNEDEHVTWDKFLALNIPRNKTVNLIHPSVQIPKNSCRLGRGIILAPNVQLSPGVNISDHCFIAGNSFIGNNAILEKYVSISDNVSVGSGARICDSVRIGSNSTIKQGVKIGGFNAIEIGSVVSSNIAVKEKEKDKNPVVEATKKATIIPPKVIEKK